METLRYHVHPHPVGPLLIGASRNGLSFLSVGERAAPDAAIISRYYPNAEISADAGVGREYADWIQAVMAGAAAAQDVPLDIAGTPFRLRVWQELQRIPYGETISYRELAARSGNESAVRAAGSACGANPVCIVIPCHRVLRSGGGLGGFACGLEVKQRLLDLEQRHAPRAMAA